ncbi:hypothetical protein HmaOT1_04905 [Haematobacter massiliensis]|nr:hypothetical protein HmaOT1_04905 [Haematobacter massiliensis]
MTVRSVSLRSLAASQPRSLAASQPRSLAASQPRSLAASQPRSLAASQPRSRSRAQIAADCFGRRKVRLSRCRRSPSVAISGVPV